MRLSSVLLAGTCLRADAIRQKRSNVVETTSFGPVIGNNGGKCQNWMGIPFAKPPVGDLRFAPTEPWTDSYPPGGLDATQVGDICVTMNAPVVGTSGVEDCLFLNVWRPVGVTAGDNLPVMVFIPGGAFMFGAGTEDTYDGCFLASNQQVIVASLNYRLNIFGWGSFEDADGNVDSNWGLEDQREALRWLRRELGAFGGDSEKITIFGESAGGISIWSHLVSPQSQGLFRAAIPMSGYPGAKDTSVALGATKDMGQRLGCADDATLRDCLRSKSAGEIMDKDDRHDFFQADVRLLQRWEPVVGAQDLPDHPYKMLAEGKSHRVPVLHGSNTDEGTFFTYLLYLVRMNDRYYENLIKRNLQDNTGNPSMNLNDEELARVMAQYPPADGFRSDSRRQYAEQATDSMFACATRFGGRQHSMHSPTWTYRFNYRSEKCPPSPALRGCPGVFHTLGLPFLFNNSQDCTPEQEAQELATRKQTYFANFAKHLDPNGESGLARWPSYHENTRMELVLQAEDTIQNFYKGDVCDLWEDVLVSKVL
jgi:para-nitrobenzyl esterase